MGQDNVLPRRGAGKDTRRRGWGTRPVALLTTLAVVASLLIASTAPAVAWPSLEHPPTVSAASLPTVQIDGVVWTQAVVGNTVYVGGSFQNARPAGSGTAQNVPRLNMLAYDIETGALVQSFAPNPNAQVRTITPSPDGSVIYVGGDFTSIAGVSRSRIAAFSAATGQLLTNFAPPIQYHVHDISATATTVYAGGNFLGVGNQYRGRLAAFNASNGSLLNWAPDASDRPVHAVQVSPDGRKVAIGGAFETLNGSSSFGKGLAVLDAVSGAVLPFAATNVIRNGGSNSAVTSLHTDGDLLYGTGYHFGAGGTLEGSFASHWGDGRVEWINSCHGDVHDIHALGPVVYSVGHAHHCGDIDGFGQRDGSDGRWDEYRATATTKQAAGTVTTNRYGGSYSNFAGNPRPDLLNFFPVLSIGSYTGQSQGPWHVTGNDRYIVMGGEFTRVNFQNQQGLVRFARRDIAPNSQGPYLFNTTYPIRVRSLWDDTVTITWPGNIDRDDARLNYRVFRRAVGSTGNGQQIHQRDVTAPFWALPKMTYTDRDGAGPSFEYRLQVRDPSNNVANSPWTRVEIVGGGSDYLRTILESEPDSLWRLGEPAGSTVARDLIGTRDMTGPTSGVTFGAAGALGEDPDTSAQFAGTSSTHFLRTAAREHLPQIFSLEAWIRAPSTTNGGLIVGFNRSESGDGDTARHDRHLYMDTSGRVQFALNPTNPVTLRSDTDLRDNQWHHVVGSLGKNGMNLYVDGKLVATRTDITNGRTGYEGVVRIGAGALNGFPNTNTTTGRRFNGFIDDVALYRSVLTQQRVRAHFQASGRATDPADAPGTLAAQPTGVAFGDVAVGGSGVKTVTLTNTGELPVKVTGIGVTGVDRTAFSTTPVDLPVDVAPNASTEVKVTFAPSAPGSAAASLEVAHSGSNPTVTIPLTGTGTVAPNVAPVASFSAQVTGSSVAFDGSGSSDADGTVVSWAWDFGDGSPAGEGPTVEHTYAATGTYTVKLTVTDDRGATGETTAQVTVNGPTDPVEVVAADLFERSLSSGWGNADTGGAWTLNVPSSFSVADGSGRIAGTTAGASRSATLNSVSVADVDLSTVLSLDRAATGGGTYVSLVGRRQSAGNEYRAQARFVSNGGVVLNLFRVQGWTDTLLGSATVPGLTYAPGEQLQMRFQLQGESLRVKLWRVGSSEPTDWLLVRTDGTAALQNPGAVGVLHFLSGSTSNLPSTLSVHELTASRARE